MKWGINLLALTIRNLKNIFGLWVADRKTCNFFNSVSSFRNPYCGLQNCGLENRKNINGKTFCFPQSTLRVYGNVEPKNEFWLREIVDCRKVENKKTNWSSTSVIWKFRVRVANKHLSSCDAQLSSWWLKGFAERELWKQFRENKH